MDEVDDDNLFDFDYLNEVEDADEEIEEEVEEEEEPEDLFHKNTPSFKCLAQIEISRSSLLRDPLYFFPIIDDPHLADALWGEKPPPEYDNVGVQRYKDLCQQEKLIPFRRVIMALDKKVLDLKYYALSEKAMKTICETLQHNSYVEELILQENWFKPESVAYLGPMIEKNQSLLVLDLKQCQIGPFGTEKLGYSLANSKTLVELDLSHNNLGDEGLEHLVPSLRDNTSIKVLNLSHNSLGDRTLFALRTVLDNNYMICDLDLSWNYFYSPIGMKELMEGLSDNIGVKRLNLSWNGIGDMATFIEIVTYFKHENSKMQHLNLSNNRITGANLRKLRPALRINESLATLNLSYNPLTPEDIKYMSGTFFDRRKTPLALTFIDFGDAWVDHSFKATRRSIRAKGCDVKIGGFHKDYVIHGPNVKEMLLNRARYLAKSCKKKKQRKDIGHFMILLKEEPVKRDEFYEMISSQKIKLDQDLVEKMAVTFRAEKGRVDLKDMKECYLRLYPDTVPPPPKKKKEKKAKTQAKGQAKAKTQ